MRHFALLLLLLTGAANSAVASIGDDGPCAQYAGVELPAEAQAATAPAEYPDCESYKSYAGIGRRVDYAAARACAWRERLAQIARLPQNPKSGVAWVVGGSTILANLYANGLGTEKNLPLAIRLACEAKDSVSSQALDDLEARLTADGTAKKRFDLCDYGATTFEMDFCASYQAEISEERRRRAFEKLSASWTSEQKSLFAKLDAEEKRYVDAHLSEVDQSGSIHGLRNMASEEIMHRNFLLDLRQFESGKTPTGMDADARREERKMQEQFDTNVAAAKTAKNPDQLTTFVTAEGIDKAQTAWEKYRDAWIAFARARYPAAPASGFRAYFARQRMELLAAMRNQIYSN